MVDSDKLHSILSLLFGENVYHEERDDSWVVGPTILDPEVIERLYDIAYSLEPFFNILGYELFLGHGEELKFELRREPPNN